MPISHDPERRIAKRLKTFEPAVLCGPDGELRRIHLLNISATGALAYGQDPPRAGMSVTLHGPLEIGQAQVRWQRDNCFGVAFSIPLSADQLGRFVEAQRSRVESTARRGAGSTMSAPGA